ncbi:hypothetical protein GLW00_12075 [Halobacillus litoralis]|uniref:Uncharacterized protein n=1 Tax=Halobacillus litoralis TaxID=45668 RepID=A0A845FD79_9BACI|nr:hypothetical protein [Halobacillus litoralis]MYL71596.1 hypothetical protein [Halobacillus litoralis]
MLSHIKFFFSMIVGLLLWNALFPSNNQAIVDILGISFLATFFKWLYEVAFEGAEGTEKS